MLTTRVLQHGRSIALCSQLLLLALALRTLGPVLSLQIDAADISWLSLFGGLQMLPIVILVAALCCRTRWAPWFGLAAAGVVLGFQMMTLGHNAGWPAMMPSILWAVTGVGLLLEIAYALNQQPAIGARPLKAVLSGGLGFSAALLPIGGLVVCLFAANGSQGGVAPKADFAARRAWGESLYGPYLEHIDGWAAASDAIREDVGDVLKIAPIDGPNLYHAGFTDGSYAVMNLEVTGTRGTGVLHLPYVEIWNTGHLQSIGSDATWTLAGETAFVASSGKSYLAEHGLDAIYSELLELAGQHEARLFVARWEDFESALASSELKSSWRPELFPRQHSPQPIEALRDEYREPMLVHFADALADLNRHQESATIYRDCAATMLARAEYEWEEQETEQQRWRVGEQLRQANALLRHADGQVPGHEETLRLARVRVVLQHLHSIGGYPQPVGRGDDAQNQDRAEMCYGIFYTEAAAWAARSPYLDREVGTTRITIDSDGLQRLQVNTDNVYAASIDLRLDGRHHSGSLNVRIRENCERCPPVDLFADTPRIPDYPLVVRSPYWTAVGATRVKLSAKTGTPMPKKAESD